MAAQKETREILHDDALCIVSGKVKARQVLSNLFNSTDASPEIKCWFLIALKHWFGIKQRIINRTCGKTKVI